MIIYFLVERILADDGNDKQLADRGRKTFYNLVLQGGGGCFLVPGSGGFRGKLSSLDYVLHIWSR